jgi:hypothetical protein
MENINIRYRKTNAASYITNGQDYQVFPDGIRVAKITLLRNVKQSHVLNVLYQTAYQSLAINPHLPEEELINLLHSLNSTNGFTDYPVKPREIVKIVKSIYHKRNKEGVLVPIENHTRKIIFSENNRYTKREKEVIRGREMGQLKRDKTRQKIHDAIDNWDLAELITQKKIKDEVKCCMRTVKTYWPDVKQMVIDKNKEIKSILEATPSNLNPFEQIDTSTESEASESTMEIESTGPKLDIEITEHIVDRESAAGLDIVIAPKEYFTEEQKEMLANFNPPNDGWSQDHIKMEFAKKYIIENASKIAPMCKFKYGFEFMVDCLTRYELNSFEMDLKDILKKGYKEYYSAKTKYVNDHKVVVQG